tara:strand:+ start:1064 stop:2191 length:1128 start_codon:yes stop_codon:yes gene_type:complete
MQGFKNKILYIESLRGLAALSVVFYHFAINSYFTNNMFVKNSWLMVDFFFLLSGFVIALSFQHKIYNFSDTLKFQARRFFRLYPLHIVMLIIFAASEYGKYLVQIKYGLVANNPAFTINNWESFMHNIFMVHVIFQEYLTWNGASWSISAEFLTYFLFALIIFTLKRRAYLIVPISILISFTAFMFLFNTNLSASNGLMRCLYSFFLGVLVWNICSSSKFNIPNFISYILIFVSIGMIIFAEPENIIGLNIFNPIVFSFMLIALQLSNQRTNLAIKVLNNKYLVYLGTISYGIYMIHGFVWWVMRQSLKYVFNFPVLQDSRGFYQVDIKDEMLSSLILIIGLFLIIFLSHISFKFLEKPINKFRGSKFILSGEKN